MIRYIIIDDEKHCRENLAAMLDKYLSGKVELVARCKNISEAKEAIEQQQPDLIFLDVEMPGGTGFDLLKQIKKINFDIIFTTAHEQYAVQAIKFSALDYLLKPIVAVDMQTALSRATVKSAVSKQQQQVENLLYNISYMNHDKKIAVPSSTGLEFVRLSEIVRCEGEGSYTTICLTEKRKLIASKNIGEYEELLEGQHFFRIHQSHLINMRCIKKYMKDDGGHVTMDDGSIIEVSRRRKDEFLAQIALH